MIFCGTGHRPDKLIGGWDNWDRHYLELTELLIEALEHHKPRQVISGFALGFDLALAKASICLSVPTIAYIPCQNQEIKWKSFYKKEYINLLEKCDQYTLISEKYDNFCMQKRNIAMVNDSDAVIALYNGDKSGGTYNCINFAQKQNKKIINLWKVYQEVFA